MQKRGTGQTAGNRRSQRLRTLALTLVLAGALALSTASPASSCGAEPDCVASLAGTRDVEKTERGVATATIRIDASPESVWSVLTDFQRWAEIFPGVSAVSIEERSDGHLAVRQVNKKLGFEIAYTTLIQLDPRSGRIEQTLDHSVANDVTAAHFVWHLRPAEERRATQVVLRARFESGQPVPRFVERSVVERGAVQSVEALRNEVKLRQSTSLLAMSN